MYNLRKYIKVMVCVLMLLGKALVAEGQKNSELPVRKKIVIIWSKGGGAHKSMLAALTSYWEDICDIVPLNPFDEIWTLKDIACNEMAQMLTDTARIFAIPKFDHTVLCDFVKNKDVVSSLNIGVELAKWSGTSLASQSLLLNNLPLLLKSVEGLEDMLAILSRSDGEDFYNYLLRHNKFSMINTLYQRQMSSLRENHAQVVQRFYTKLAQEKPDLVISVMPLFNQAILEASTELEVPFLLISPDFDISNYFLGQKARYPLTCSLPFNDSILLQKAAQVGITKDNLKLYGLPLPKSFFEEKDRSRICKEFTIPEDKKVIMILMGGAGSQKVKWYVKEIARAIQEPVHILACVGLDGELAYELRREIMLPEHIGLTVVDYTERIADLMAVSTILITKPGPMTLYGAVQAGIPVILDTTSGVLDWEASHVSFVKIHDFGRVITAHSEPGMVISALLNDSAYLRDIRQRMFLLRNTTFPQEITQLVQQLIEKGEQTRSALSFKKLLKNYGGSLLAVAGTMGALAAAYYITVFYGMKHASSRITHAKQD